MRFLFSVLLLCLLSLPSFGQEALLWRISGKNLLAPSYLLGTLHAYCVEDVSLPEGTEEALAASDRLILETKLSDPGMQSRMLPLMKMRNGRELSSLYKRGDYEVLEDYFQDSLGLNLELLAHFQPLYLSSLLYSRVLNCPIQSMEMYLSGRALQQGLAIEGLETAEEQAELLSHMPYREQADFLLQAVVEMDSLRAAYWDAVVSYKNRDLASLFYALKAGTLGSPSYTKALLDDRNRRWVPQLEQTLKQGSSFIAVGAGHLPGPNGLLELLKRRGYTLTPIH